MLTQILATSALALMSGALIIPASRNIMLGDVKLDWLAGELELDKIDTDNFTVLLKSGVKFNVYKIKGINYDAKIGEEQINLQVARAEAIDQLGKLGLNIRLFVIKRQTDISHESQWPCKTLQEIGDQEAKLYKNSYRIDYYITLAAKDLKTLDDGNKILIATLGKYSPKLLSSNTNDKCCHLTGFLNYLVSGNLRYDLPAITTNLSKNLSDSDLIFDDEMGLITSFAPTPKYNKIITIKLWPEFTSGIVFHQILSHQGDIEIVQIAIPFAQMRALAMLKRDKNQNIGGFMSTDAKLGGVVEQMEKITDGNTTLFTTQLQIILRENSLEKLDDLLHQITQILARARILYNIETKCIGRCYFNKIAGNDRLIRPLNIDDEPVAALWPFHYSSVGQPASPYGDLPVRQFRTPSGQAYSFQFHIRRAKQSLGNYLVFAGSGSGKSTLIMHLLSGLAKFKGVSSYIFDSNEGAKFMIEAMGGHYQSYDDLSLNPLDVGEDTPQARQRINLILRVMLGSEFKPDEDDEMQLNHAINEAFLVNPPDRTLDVLFDPAFPKKSQLRKLMAKWVTDAKGKKGLYSHIFNAKHDSLVNILNKSHLIGINMNEALSDPDLGAAIVAHISAAIKNAAKKNQNGFNIFIDEAANLLQNDGFCKLAMEMFREYRKLDGAVGMAFQDPTALFDSGIGKAVLDNTATLIFFPNASATVDNLAPFNLNDEQIRFITDTSNIAENASDNQQLKRQVLIIKRESATGFNESAIINVDLSSLGDAIRFYRAGTAANADLAQAKIKWGDQWLTNL